MRRTTRLFALAEHLRGRRSGVTAEALAQRFGVTVRTIYRDLDALRDASFPLHAERGRGGGYALDRSYSLPPVNFSAREAALLLLAGHFLQTLRILPFGEPLVGALDKVRGALPAAGQRDLAALEKRLAFVGVPAHPVAKGVLAALERAFFEGGALRLTYDGRDGPSQRTVRVESLVLERTETRLNVWDYGKRAARQLQLHRVREATVVAAPLEGAA
jgi:predicted DNA-binding transcriptional regulator YafY